MTSKLLLLIIIFIPVVTFAQSANSGKEKKTQPKVLFFDDFSGQSLDRTKWNVVITGFNVNDEQQAYVDSSKVIYTIKGESEGAKNGALVIEPVYSPGFVTFDGKKFDFLSGRIDTQTKFEFAFGAAAARIKMPAGSGLWPAFWALGNGDWPDTGEIDIMEYVGEPDWVSAALHGPRYSGDTPLVNKVYFKKDFDVTKWHIYSVEWTTDALLFKVDDVLFYRVTRPMIENYGKWAFDNPKYMIVNLALGGAYPMKTNGVKKPYPGIPQQTLDLIKSGKAKYIIDWVRITN
jgi:beta-glucanase (GH16 family)